LVELCIKIERGVYIPYLIVREGCNTADWKTSPFLASHNHHSIVSKTKGQSFASRPRGVFVFHISLLERDTVLLILGLLQSLELAEQEKM